MTWKQTASAAAGVGASFLPKLACPFCWPAYAGLLSALGLSFLLSANYLFALIAAFLLISVGSLAFRAKVRHGYGPVLLGSVAGLIILIAKFRFESIAVMYIGVATLVTASLWNSWPASSTRPRSAPAGFVQLSVKEKSS